MEKETFNTNIEQALQQWAQVKEQTPKGYFEQAPQQLFEVIKLKKSKRTSVIYTLSKVAIAAVVVTIIANLYFLKNVKNSFDIKDISTEEIEGYISMNEVDFLGSDDKNTYNDIVEYVNETKDSLIN